MFRERIQANYSKLTSSFRNLADFILQNQLDAAFMTATEMAKHLDVDAATVVRFAQALGYSGFRQLIKEIRCIVKAELLASRNPSIEASDDAELIRSLIENERHNLVLAQARVTKQANDILPALAGAEHIWVTGQGTGAYLAGMLASSLTEIGLPAAATASDTLVTATRLRDLAEADVVIGFSVTGLELDVANAIEFARKQGAKTLVLSASEVAPAVLVADIAVVCPGPTQTQITSVVGLTALSTALVAAYAARNSARIDALQDTLKSDYQSILEMQVRRTADFDIEDLWRRF
ncbi:MAG: MurR/RpiR family transcriptional regulator [Anaerolineae bacterium]|nr:MurR/RpiR family transcriptional regulator [Anaerolineae bacterium]